MDFDREKKWWDAKAPQEEEDESLMEEFFNLCERFDLEIMPGGPGTRQRAGLIAVAEVK